MRHPEPTCGALFATFQAACERQPWLQPDAIPHGQVRFADRALGHMQGQAEKVASGACYAFMIRPGADWWRWAHAAMLFVCGHYGLNFYSEKPYGELWAYRELWVCDHLTELYAFVAPNSPLWHVMRADLCGIREVDIRYHQRSTFGQRCEPDPQQTEEKNGGTTGENGVQFGHNSTPSAGAGHTSETTCHSHASEVHVS